MKKYFLLFLFTFTGALAQSDVKFTAKITNKNSDSIVIEGMPKFKKVIHLNKKGEFSESFSVTPGLHRLFDGVEYTFMHLKNGYDLTLTMDAKRFDESIVYSGKGSEENNFLAQKALADEELEELMATTDATGFAKAIEARAARLEKQLQNVADPEFKASETKAYLIEGKRMEMLYDSAQKQKKLVGSVAPQFDYENHKGGKTKLSDLKGKYVYIDNWATWCAPCRAEIPYLKKIEERYHGKNIEFVSISIDEQKDHAKWKKFVTDKQLGGIQLYADNAWNSQFIRDFGITSIPRFLLIAPDGTVIDADAKRPSQPELIAQLDELLK